MSARPANPAAVTPHRGATPPHRVTAGVGASRGVSAEEVRELVLAALAAAGLPPGALKAMATLDSRAAEPGVRLAAALLRVPVTGYPAQRLAEVTVAAPSAAVAAAVGTPSVAEAAALLSSGATELLVPKRKSGRTPSRATCALAAGPGPDAPQGTAVGYGGAPHHRPAATGPDPLPEAAMNPSPATPVPPPAAAHDLRHHGDAEVRDDGAALTDLAVNVRTGTPPSWLAARIADSLTTLAAYPDGRTARAAVATRHGLGTGEVLLTAGAAEAFVLVARALRVRRPVVVHPQFTEPEAALRDAGHEVERVLLRADEGFVLDPERVPEDADLVVVGNPTNPTSVLHPAGVLERLARPGRYLVVDEAFMDAVPREREALAGRVAALPGLIVLRSLTKTWGLAGLRIGYVLAEAGTIRELEQAQPLWPVSTPALAAAEACMEPAALAEAEAAARRSAADRSVLVAGLESFADRGLRVAGPAEGPFVLLTVPDAEAVRSGLRDRGFAVRRGDTFPGLDRDWLRLAVRDRSTTEAFLAALGEVLRG